MKLDIFYGSEVFVTPKKEIVEKLDSTELTDLKLLILIMADETLRANFDFETAAKKLKCARSDIEASLKFWVGAGIIKTSDQPGKTTAPNQTRPLPAHITPLYTSAELADIMEKNKNLQRLINECQNIVGKILNPREINSVAALVDYLRLEPEHILMIFTYCRDQDKTSVRYIENFAYATYDEGIDTLEKFEAYVKSKEEYKNLSSKLRTLFGFGERALTTKETEMFNTWCAEWDMQYEMIKAAYEITINNTKNHQFSIGYINKILTSWHEAGYNTLSEIESAREAYKINKEKAEKVNSSFDTDEFFELALKRGDEKTYKK